MIQARDEFLSALARFVHIQITCYICNLFKAFHQKIISGEEERMTQAYYTWLCTMKSDATNFSTKYVCLFCNGIVRSEQFKYSINTDIGPFSEGGHFIHRSH